MAIIKCPECDNDCSSIAKFCPKCGFPFKDNAQDTKQDTNEIKYETIVKKIRCWGRGSRSINRALEPYLDKGWETISIDEDHWSGGILSPVYAVTFRKPIDTNVNDNYDYEVEIDNNVILCEECGYQIFSEESKCSFCGANRPHKQ